MVLAGVERTLTTDVVDVIGARFIRQPTGNQVTVGGQALTLDRDPQTGRWAGGDGQFGHVRGAAWSTLTRHLSAPHAPVAPLSALGHVGRLHHPGWAGPGRPIARSFNPLSLWEGARGRVAHVGERG